MTRVLLTIEADIAGLQGTTAESWRDTLQIVLSDSFPWYRPLVTIAHAPATAASRPVPQAATGTVADPSAAAAPVARAVDIGMCRCGHPIGEHDADGNGWCTGSTVWVDAQSDWLACECKGYAPAGGAS